MSTTDLPLPTSEQEPPAALPVLPYPTRSQPRVGTPVLSVETLAYLAIGLLSVLTHLWGLGDRALHHDETLHAVYSWYLYQGRGYMHDPLLHGPFLYHFGALMYLLFGDNDTTARLGVALFGIVLPLTPYLLRRELGRVGALLASIYLLLSPSVLYMGRFVRHDMYSLLFEMLVVVGIIRYLRSRRPGWLYLSAAAFGLMLVNQETSYLFAVIMAGALLVPLLWRVWKPGVPLLGLTALLVVTLVFILPGEAATDGENNATRDAAGQIVVKTPGPLFGWAPLETADNGYALRIRNRADTDSGRNLIENLFVYLADLWSFFRHPAVLLALGALLAVAGFLVWTTSFQRGRDGLSPWQRVRKQHPDTVLDAFASLGDRRRVLIALGIFALIYTLFFTAFFTNVLGIITGTTGSVLYWLAQHEVQRGGQPGYYYLVLLAIYEPLVVIWSVVAAGIIGVRWWRNFQQTRDRRQETGDRSDNNRLMSESPDSVDHPSPITHHPSSSKYQASPESLTVPIFLLWWSVATIGIYSWAGEKMPWLVIHLVLPLTLLGAWGCERAIRACLGARYDEDGTMIERPSLGTLGIVVGLVGVVSLLGFMLMSTLR